ncbi:MAG: LCP family protein [Thermomicrobiales bacterium]|nr:LCP family protein [Thermomicrobiales bacterium]
MLKRAITRRLFAVAGAIVTARGGLITPQSGYTQTPTPGPYTTPEPPPDPQPSPSALSVQDGYTFLIGGLDTRGMEQHENTDVMMISRVEPANKRVRTISVPRDLWAEIPGNGEAKINGALNIGMGEDHDWNAGAQLFRDTFEWNFNLKIDGVVTTNLHKMPGVIDAIGGITVDNPYRVYEDEYPTADYGFKSIDFPAGEIRLNGEEALEFSRTRHYDSDEGRVIRQHLVLAACLAELQKPENITRIPDIFAGGEEFVATDIPAEVQGQLVASVPDIDPELVEWGTVIDYLTGANTDDGGWVYSADWSYLPYHVRGWLGVGYLDANRP